MFQALAVSFWISYRSTLAAFLALPCYGADGKGPQEVCSTAPGSFNRAMLDADKCGGNWGTEYRDGRPYYVAVCPVANDCDTY